MEGLGVDDSPAQNNKIIKRRKLIFARAREADRRGRVRERERERETQREGEMIIR